MERIIREKEGTQKAYSKLKCPVCSYHGIYFRETKILKYKCKKCGKDFNL